MYSPRKKILWFAVASRIMVLILQFVFNAICPDHDAGVFMTPTDPAEIVSNYDKVVDILLSGLSRWDAQYFLHIAKYGYTYENSLAFFPLYPMTIRYSSMFLKIFLYMLNESSVMMIAATLVNFACFVKSALVLYDLSKKVLKNTVLAYKAALLYCINPSSIFFSAFYTESMFAYVTFYSMLAYTKHSPYVYLPIGLSALVRSNGLINVGFPIHAWLKSLLSNTIPNTIEKSKNIPFKLMLPYICLPIFGKCLFILNTVLLSLTPFFLLQVYNYSAFCITRPFDVPFPVLQYGMENAFEFAGSKSSGWCNSSVPIAYTYVQKKYWDVGFMKYYCLKQVPNFILAFPVLYIMLKCSVKYLIEHRTQLYSLGLRSRISSEKNESASRKYPQEMFVFVVHGLFLTLFCIFFVHIQVSTRLLASASPLLYWYCAYAMSYGSNPNIDNFLDFENTDNLYSKWKVFFFSQRGYSTNDELVLSYFLGYLVVGCFMHSNFLPWT